MSLYLLIATVSLRNENEVNMAELTQWYNLIFLVPGGLALVLLLVAGAFSAGDNSAGDADGDADVDADANIDSDADGEVEEESASQMSHGALALIGGGKAPLTLLIGTLLLGWGFSGYWANELLGPVVRQPVLLVCASVPLAAVCAVLLSRTAAGLISRYAPKMETAAVMRASLAGQEARVVYPISAASGRAYHYDKKGILHDLPCRVRAGQPEIAKGKTVILVGYDDAARSFWAEPSPFDAG